MYFFKREKYFQKKPLFWKRIVSNTPYSLLNFPPDYLAQPEIHGQDTTLAGSGCNGCLPVIKLRPVDDIVDTDAFPFFPGIEPTAIVGYAKRDQGTFLPDRNFDSGGPCMFKYVVQLLLYNTKDRHFQLVVQQRFTWKKEVEAHLDTFGQLPDIFQQVFDGEL